MGKKISLTVIFLLITIYITNAQAIAKDFENTQCTTQPVSAEHFEHMSGIAIEVKGVINISSYFGYDASYKITVPYQTAVFYGYYYKATSSQGYMLSAISGKPGRANTQWYIFNGYYYIKGTHLVEYTIIKNGSSFSGIKGKIVDYTDPKMYFTPKKDSLP